MSSFNDKIFNVVSEIANISDNPFKGKWVSILGDSISTYEGYIPKENATYYPNSYINDVTKTWWHILLTKLGAKLCVNNSYSGRKVACEGTYGVETACKALHRVKGTTYKNLDGTEETATANINPDVILVLLGVNDFLNDSTAGTVTFHKSESFSTTDFAKSYESMLLAMAANTYPKAKIFCLNITFTSNKYGFFVANGAGSKLNDFRKVIEELCEGYECNVIHMNRLGIHQGNMPTYSPDKIHPNSNMMIMIAKQCYHEMIASNCL